MGYQDREYTRDGEYNDRFGSLGLKRTLDQASQRYREREE